MEPKEEPAITPAPAPATSPSPPGGEGPGVRGEPHPAITPATSPATSPSPPGGEGPGVRGEPDLAAQVTELKSQLHQARIAAALEIAALQAGFHSPADALALADLSLVNVDDHGKVTGAATAIKKLAEQRPYLVKGASPGLGTPSTSTTRRPGTTEPQEQAPLIRF